MSHPLLSRPKFRPCVWPRAASILLVIAVVVCAVWLHADARVSDGPHFSESDLWLAPTTYTAGGTDFSLAVADLEAGHADLALPVFERHTSDQPLGPYARLYEGRAQLALGQQAAALETAKALVAGHPPGALGEASLWLEANAAGPLGDWADALGAYQSLTAMKPTQPAAAYLGLGLAAEKLGTRDVAAEAFRKVYYEFPLTDQASEAEQALVTLPPLGAADRTAREITRAQALFDGHRYADARKAFVALRAAASRDDRLLVDLRIPECDYYLEHYAVARQALSAYLSHSKAHETEARLFYLNTIRFLPHEDDYPSLVHEFADRNPTDPLAEAALNTLATHYILDNDDEEAAAVFADMYRRFSRGVYAERAAWKAGWWSYKTGALEDAVRIFDSALAGFPRSDYRPSWLYWSARANQSLNHVDLAAAGYRRIVAEYRNSYYGREADRQLASLGTNLATAAAPPDPPLAIVAGPPPPNAALVKALLSAGLYDDAVAEIRRLERERGSSPILEATVAFALNRKGDFRSAITSMRRAYPQFMAEGGEELPRDILSVIFPIDYWSLITEYASARNLDPFLMAALIAQESTFQPDVRSSANAWGLMQLLPSTGRRYAPTLGIRPFTTHALTDPEVNIRIGMAYFGDLMTQFGDVAAALAAYNAGESHVTEWLAERHGMPRDQFIDDIPFPETQNYVKRVIGTAENYRALYGTTSPDPVRESGR